jgi:CRP-like cAMP-binding protein
VSWRFFQWGEATSVRELVARHEYAKAIGVLRATLKKQPGDRRLRLDLANVLVHAGDRPQAIKVLLELADELFRGDFRARARVVLKRVEELDPGRPDVAERLEVLDEMERAASRRSARPVSPAAPAPGPEAPDTSASDGPISADPVGAGAATVATPLVDPSEEEIPIDTTALDSGTLAATEPASPPGSALLNGLAGDAAADFLSTLPRVERAPGDVLVTEGEKGTDLFLIASGSVSVFVKDKNGQSARVAQLHAGEFFGEVGALTGLRRIATVTAATRCELLVVKKPALGKLLAEHPELRGPLEESLERRVADPLAIAARGKRVRRHVPGRPRSTPARRTRRASGAPAQRG